MNGDANRFTSDRRPPQKSSWAGSKDWGAGSLSHLHVVDGAIVPEPTLEFADIADSEANQKLAHRWSLSAASGPFVDLVGSADATDHGTEQATGDWVDGAARSGAGGYLETTTWGDFFSNVGSDFAMAVSIQTTDGLGRVSSFQNESDRTGYGFISSNRRGGGGEINCYLRDRSGNYSDIYTGDNLIDDGDPYRVVWNKIGNSPADWEIWVNGSKVRFSVYSSGASGFSNPDHAVPMFGANGRGALFAIRDCVLDDFCVYNDSLTDIEVQSYDVPWAGSVSD